MPGRQLGELVSSGLRKRGFEAEDVSYEEPFFVTLCRSGEIEYEVLSYIYWPDKRDRIWAVDCSPRLGFIPKLFGRSEESKLGAILGAIHDILKSEPRVRKMRWFKDLPAEPFAVRRYALSPKADI